MERKDLNRIKMILVEKHRTFEECLSLHVFNMVEVQDKIDKDLKGTKDETEFESREYLLAS